MRGRRHAPERWFAGVTMTRVSKTKSFPTIKRELEAMADEALARVERIRMALALDFADDRVPEDRDRHV